MNMGRTHKASEFQLKKLIVPGVVMLAFWGIGLWGCLASGYTQPLIMFGYIGTSIGVGLGLYATLPKQRSRIGRRLTLFLVGLFLMGFAIFMGHENVQIEGFMFGLLTGVVQMAVIHYLIAKIFGPLLFGRLWCGWACWTVMVLDLLPFKRPSGRLPARWGWLRYLHFGLSLGLVLHARLRLRLPQRRDGTAGGDLVHHRQPGLLCHRHRAGLHAQGQSRVLQIRLPGQRAAQGHARASRCSRSAATQPSATTAGHAPRCARWTSASRTTSRTASACFPPSAACARPAPPSARRTR